MEKRENRGRRKGSILVPLSEQMVRINATIRPNQRSKFKAIGGSKWLRDMIDGAAEPPKASKTKHPPEPPTDI